MDDKTKTMMLTIAAGAIKKGLLVAGTSLAGHGIIAGNQIETFVAVGMVIASAGYSFYQDYGKAILISQLEVLKAKSLAQAAKMKDAGVPPVTAAQIAAQSPTLSSVEVVKTVNSLPAAIQSTMVKIMLVAFVLSFLVAGGSAQAQVKLKPPQVTGNIVEDAKANLGIPHNSGSVLTGNPQKDLIALYGKLQAVSLVDLKYALNIATKKNNKAAGQCWSAIITQIEQDQTANLDDKGQPLPTPDPHLFTDVERLSDVINSLGPNSDLMVGCGSFANQAKMNVVQLIGTILAGGAGIAAIAP